MYVIAAYRPATPLLLAGNAGIGKPDRTPTSTRHNGLGKNSLYIKWSRGVNRGSLGPLNKLASPLHGQYTWRSAAAWCKCSCEQVAALVAARNRTAWKSLARCETARRLRPRLDANSLVYFSTLS